MKNVYDIRRDKNLIFILPEEHHIDSQQQCTERTIAIFVHLYYIETIEYYFKYIKNISKQFDIVFTSSSQSIKKEIVRCAELFGLENYVIIDKDNRGRDISALLVSCRELALKYEIICFVHDKKEKSKRYKADTLQWIENLWGHTLGSRRYIDNIIAVLRHNKQIGMLTPPEPIRGAMRIFFGDTWGENFEITKDLADRIGLKCDLSRNKPPITLGTVFWAKVDAIKKLFEMGWNYADFPKEPLPEDGTISHAIERILAYVIQDSGYDTGTVMTDSFAGKRIEYMEWILKKSFNRLGFSGISTINELIEYDKKQEMLVDAYSMYDKLFIYGTGRLGYHCFCMLREKGKYPTGFIVSADQDAQDDFYGIPVFRCPGIIINKGDVVVVAVKIGSQADICQKLKNSGVCNIIVF